MNVFFRVDSSIKIGTGHVMRCLTLADELKKTGAEVSFITRELPGSLNDFVEMKGFKLYRLPDKSKRRVNGQSTSHSSWLSVGWNLDANQTIEVIEENSSSQVDLLVIDHYAIDYKWENKLKNHVKKILVIDDLADRTHECDFLLDQNYDLYERYNHLVPKSCELLLGPKYALLRNEFRNARKKYRDFNRKTSNVLVFFGGTDPTNETEKVIKALEDDLIVGNIHAHVVVGQSNPNKINIKRLCEQLDNTAFYCQVDHMAELMLKSDLAISAAGSTTWERCCMGLPAITMAVAKNQIDIATHMSQMGIDLYLGESRNVGSFVIQKTFKEAIMNSEKIYKASVKAMELVDGEGVFRIMSKII